MENKSEMKLPNEPESFWIASTPQIEHSSLMEDINVDVAIVGGGMVGITSAYLLKQEGLKVAIIEADRILRGTTGHTTAKITSQHGLRYNKIKTNISEEVAKQYAQSNEYAIKFIHDLVDRKNIDCDFREQSAYIYTNDDNYIKQIQDEAATAASLGIKASYVQETPLPFKVKAAVRFDGQAQFHPRKYLLALSREIDGDGCRIFEHTRAVDIEKDGDLYNVITSEGKKVSAKRVIVASHYPFYNFEGFYFARIYTERSYVLAVKINGNYPGGMYINAENPTRSLRSQNLNDGSIVLISGERHKTGQGIDMMTHYENLKNFAYETFDVEDILYRWSTQDCMTLDDIPYVGLFTSKTPNLYIATGFGKWGMTGSTVSALLLRDLIIKGKSPWQDVYSPSRTNIKASAKNFIVENANVAGQLISGKMQMLPQKLDIKPGEAKVIDSNGQKNGAYMDINGRLHLVDTTCTHLGCELKWNSAEKTWDCPCHGSRFTYEGKIVEGPAVKPLKHIEKDIH